MSKSSSGLTQPPKSKVQPYYAISPIWSDVKPIPQIDAPLSTSTSTPETTPLASIAYTPRYAEAMSYLRAVMADNEHSPRCLSLTEDIISMNPAHYTVWIYRMRILLVMWGVSPEPQSKVIEIDDDENELVTHVMQELAWLDAIALKNLKNYQIWHHRHSLLDLLPALPSNEPAFLTQILDLDHKNYHVWTYRQWLCTRFPDPLLSHLDTRYYTTNIELHAMNEMLAQDIHNNSAWNHRYFILFGSKELAQSTAQNVSLKKVNRSGIVAGLRDVLDAELAYVQEKIRLAPQNGSSWNYLRGLVRFAGWKVERFRAFCEEFLGPEADLWVGSDGGVVGVRSSRAIEMLVDIYAGSERERAKECLKALGEKWDIIRKRYWDYRLKCLEESWVQGKEMGKSDSSEMEIQVDA